MPEVTRPIAGHLLHWLIGLLLLTACMPTTVNSTQYPNANVRPQPTVPPPPWVPSSAPIALDNVAKVVTLGRLDQPSTPSTVFAFSVSPDTTRLAGLNNAKTGRLGDEVTAPMGRAKTKHVPKQGYLRPAHRAPIADLPKHQPANLRLSRIGTKIGHRGDGNEVADALSRVV